MVLEDLISGNSDLDLVSVSDYGLTGYMISAVLAVRLFQNERWVLKKVFMIKGIIFILNLRFSTKYSQQTFI